LSRTAPFERGATDEAAHCPPRRLRKAASLGDEMRSAQLRDRHGVLNSSFCVSMQIVAVFDVRRKADQSEFGSIGTIFKTNLFQFIDIRLVWIMAMGSYCYF
jgi:hypothetical protein